jgi:hypothetical protein
MAVVRSTWADKPIFIGKFPFPFPMGGPLLASSEWSGAGMMSIPAGHLMVKNDAQFLYVALDLVSDNGQTPGTGDYFWFSVDVDGNRQITPNRDINYGLYPDQPNRLARQYFLGPGTWTTILNEESDSAVRIGFESSPNSSSPHRIWEMRLALKELGVDLGASPIPPTIRFGLRVASNSPPFTYDYPYGFYWNFSNLHEIVLARQSDSMYPSGTAGAVIGGVGLIPASAITDGYATTASSYHPHVVDAAFGGVLNLIGNRVTMQNLWNQGARKYKILSQFESATPGTFAPVRQSWTNYRWDGTKYVLEHFGADSQNLYPLLDPTQDYSIDDLLLQWNSVGYPAGIHQFKAEFYQDNGTTLVPSDSQVLSLKIDNNLPQVDIVDIWHNDRAIAVCEFGSMASDSDGIQVEITVNDAEGNLASYALYAHYGKNTSAFIASDSYANHASPSRQWQGVSNLRVPSGKWVPPRTCAYQFRLSATPRVTNGYSYIGYVESTHHITLIKPGTGTPVVAQFSKDFPLGLLGRDRIAASGEEPTQLGNEALESIQG